MQTSIENISFSPLQKYTFNKERSKIKLLQIILHGNGEPSIDDTILVIEHKGMTISKIPLIFLKCLQTEAVYVLNYVKLIIPQEVFPTRLHGDITLYLHKPSSQIISVNIKVYEIYHIEIQRGLCYTRNEELSVSDIKYVLQTIAFAKSTAREYHEQNIVCDGYVKGIFFYTHINSNINNSFKQIIVDNKVYDQDDIKLIGTITVHGYSDVLLYLPLNIDIKIPDVTTVCFYSLKYYTTLNVKVNITTNNTDLLIFPLLVNKDPTI